MTARARDVADAIRQRLPGVGSVKLHKLLYYAQGHHLADVGEPLFSDVIVAWDRGPVVGGLWTQERADETPGDLSALREAELNTIGYILSRYGGLSGHDLTVLTHADFPWREADGRRREAGQRSATIRQTVLREHFSAAIKDDDDDEGMWDFLGTTALAEFLEAAHDTLEAPAEPDSHERLASFAARGE